MKYLLLIYSNPASWECLSSAERDQLMREVEALMRELRGSDPRSAAVELPPLVDTSADLQA